MLMLLKWLPFLAKIGAVSKWLSFIPGAQIFGLVGSLLGLFASFFKWLLADIFDAFQEWQRFVVRSICFLVFIGLGFYYGIETSKGYVAQARHETQVAQQQTKEWQAAHQKLLDEASAIDATDKSRHLKALAAKRKAEADEQAKIEQEKKAAPAIVPVKPVQVVPIKPADTAAQPDSVQPKPARKAAHCKNSGSETGLFGFAPLWGSALPCKSI